MNLPEILVEDPVGEEVVVVSGEEGEATKHVPGISQRVALSTMIEPRTVRART